MKLDTIRNRKQLAEHLRTAVQVELATLPMYLYSLYSIREKYQTENPFSDSYKKDNPYTLVRSVAVEEMLHLAIACNLLTSIGEKVQLYCPPGPDSPFPDFVSRPFYMPHRTPPLLLSLDVCRNEHVRSVFMEFELPETENPSALLEPIQGPGHTWTYHTLGQFYQAVQKGFAHLGQKVFRKKGQVDLQLPPRGPGNNKPPYMSYFPVSGNAEDTGDLTVINSVESAIKAIEVIIDQGEGTSGIFDDPSKEELAHYYKFKWIAEQTLPDDFTYNLAQNPTDQDYPPKALALSRLFNASFCFSLVLMESIYQEKNQKKDKTRLLNMLFNSMNLILGPVAKTLIQQVLPNGLQASPTFEFYAFQHDDFDARAWELITLCQKSMQQLEGDPEALMAIQRVYGVLLRQIPFDEQPALHFEGPFYFTRDILPLINSRDKQNMQNVHPSFDLSKYQTWVDHVHILSESIATDMPKFGPLFSMAERKLIIAWINQNPAMPESPPKS